jgi:hypothetical protein
MKRFLICVVSAAALLATACSNGTPTIMSPTAASSDLSVATSGGPVVDKYYTVGGVVQSVQKPFLALEGARIEAIGGGNDGRSTVSGDGGSFALPLRAGNVTIVVSRDGYESWSSTLALFDNQPDLKPMLMPKR